MGKGTCSVEECEAPRRTRGLCQTHYMRWRRTGQLDAEERRQFPTNLYSRIGEKDENGCRPWLGCVDPHGYGRVSAPNKVGISKPRHAYRVAYELMVGPVDEGKELDHTCGNRLCVNVEHLEPVDHATNVKRGRAGEAQAGKTHCPKGHAYSEDNTYVHGGRRFCRTCGREAKRRYKQKKRAERA